MLPTMKSIPVSAWAAACLLLAATVNVDAQYKAPSQYFRKDSPGARPGGQPPSGAPGSPAAPSAPAAPAAAPAPAAKPRFKDLAVNAQFYFINDTNRAFPWTKLSATSAKNAKGVTRAFPGETMVQR